MVNLHEIYCKRNGITRELACFTCFIDDNRYGNIFILFHFYETRYSCWLNFSTHRFSYIRYKNLISVQYIIFLFTVLVLVQKLNFHVHYFPRYFILKLLFKRIRNPWYEGINSNYMTCNNNFNLQYSCLIVNLGSLGCFFFKLYKYIYMLYMNYFSWFRNSWKCSSFLFRCNAESRNLCFPVFFLDLSGDLYIHGKQVCSVLYPLTRPIQVWLIENRSITDDTIHYILYIKRITCIYGLYRGFAYNFL